MSRAGRKRHRSWIQERLLKDAILGAGASGEWERSPNESSSDPRRQTRRRKEKVKELTETPLAVMVTVPNSVSVAVKPRSRSRPSSVLVRWQGTKPTPVFWRISVSISTWASAPQTSLQDRLRRGCSPLTEEGL